MVGLRLSLGLGLAAALLGGRSGRLLIVFIAIGVGIVLLELALATGLGRSTGLLGFGSSSRGRGGRSLIAATSIGGLLAELGEVLPVSPSQLT